MRAHVVLSPELLDEVDRLVGPRRRSEFFAEAIREKLKRTRLEAAARNAVGSLANDSIEGWESSASAAAWVHVLRRADDRLSGQERKP